MAEKWGSVDGDINADAIMMDRKREAGGHRLAGWLFALPMIASAIWYGFSGLPAALALTIVLAVERLGLIFHRELFLTHTMLMVAERRVQLLEHKLQELQVDLSIGTLVVTSRPEAKRAGAPSPPA